MLFRQRFDACCPCAGSERRRDRGQNLDSSECPLWGIALRKGRAFYFPPSVIPTHGGIGLFERVLVQRLLMFGLQFARESKR